ncbi:hypothetical protein RchiOBHm_Chr2g0158201 [Rosa chinensis]|uniref:Uncharacterized protein n=1 Tax=Rosa chinensis TaxID=74649 RepID=A0A2P6S1Z9_ROSCH|nr:hypothetical protein RchiOBHm_Chr2g0158201 [Rosa chinensis]
MQKGFVLIFLLPLLYLCFGSIVVYCFYSDTGNSVLFNFPTALDTVMAAKPEETEIRRHLRHENGEGQASGPISDMEKDRQIRSRRWRQLMAAETGNTQIKTILQDDNGEAKNIERTEIMCTVETSAALSNVHTDCQITSRRRKQVMMNWSKNLDTNDENPWVITNEIFCHQERLHVSDTVRMDTDCEIRSRKSKQVSDHRNKRIRNHQECSRLITSQTFSPQENLDLDDLARIGEYSHSIGQAMYQRIRQGFNTEYEDSGDNIGVLKPTAVAALFQICNQHQLLQKSGRLKMIINT